MTHVDINWDNEKREATIKLGATESWHLLETIRLFLKTNRGVSDRVIDRKDTLNEISEELIKALMKRD